ncbi:hypothetical protein Syun_009167 [Stephania yunnanensis]|uniref:Uncharacterized protein n=1 Tax=Stephania yunnanensis TaxID=152371 RepID=A0AAP0KFN4_9MAGN
MRRENREKREVSVRKKKNKMKVGARKKMKREEDEERRDQGIVIWWCVNVRGKVVISSFTYNGLANPTKMVVLFNPLSCLLTNPLA